MRYIATITAQIDTDGTMEGLEFLESARIDLPEFDNFDPDQRIEDINQLGWYAKYRNQPVEFFVTYEKVESLIGFARTIVRDEFGELRTR